MYPPERFTDADPGAGLAIARVTKFATVVAVAPDGPVTVHAPFTVADATPPGRLIGHVMRSNPLVRLLADGAIAARLVFVPADGYVSPRVYAEKPVSGKVVPTWNYVAAHLDGMLAAAPGQAELLEILAAQSRDYEGATGGDWRLADAPSDFIATMAAALVGLSFTVTHGLAIRKLSQNRPQDRASVRDWLARTRPETARIDHWMKDA